MAANLLTLRRRADGTFIAKPGIRLNFINVKEDGTVLGTVNGVVIGPRYGRLAKRALIIPRAFVGGPEIGRDGDYAYRGSFIANEDGTNPQLAAFDPSRDPEGTCYLRVQTGIDPNVPGGASEEISRMAALMGLQPGQPFRAFKHGSVAMQAGPDTHRLLGMGEDVSMEEAEEVWRYVAPKGNLRLGVPPFTDVIFRMKPKRSPVFGGEMNGKVAVVENRAGEVVTTPADELREEFEGLITPLAA